MARVGKSSFAVGAGVDSNGDWRDYELVDNSPKGPLRSWRLSVPVGGTALPYAMLSRSTTVDDCFEDAVVLPVAMVRVLCAVVGAPYATARVAA